jgi:hypothetical protein
MPAKRKPARSIPRSFDLMGHQVAVEIVPASRWAHGEACIGIFSPQAMRIEIVDGLNQGTTEHTFWHEATHAMLHILSSPHYQDEVLVDQLGGLLHQMMQSWRA